MFFCAPNAYPPAGLFSIGHLILFLLAAAGVAVALFFSRRMDEPAIRRTVRVLTAVLWAMEAGKILFVLLVAGSRNPNDFVPLYYCSIVLYAGVLSSLPEGRLRCAGDCFLATAGLVGGLAYLISPTSTLLQYPAFHVLSLHSFFLHGAMVYLGLLLLIRGVYRPVFRDILYPATIISVVCALALLFNLVYDRANGVAIANLMFLSQNTPGTPLAWIWRLTGRFYTPFMWLVQAYGPFLLAFWATELFRKIKQRKIQA